MPTPGVKQVNITHVIDRSRLGGVQITTFVLCLLCLIMDGFDVQALGYTAPALIQDWGVSPSALGPVFAAGNFGVLIGALFFSMVADRVGRRPVLIWATFFFAVMTLLTARAATVGELLALRFIAGIGLGCIIPNATSLVGEFSPGRNRVTLVMAITVGFTVGAAIGGFIAAWLIPAFGWRSVFYFGGAVPLVIGVAMLLWLPESLQFMVLRGRDRARIAAWLKRIDPSVEADATTEFHIAEQRRTGVPLMHLFREGRGIVTVMLWVVNFMNLLNLYSLASWLPTLVRDAGYSTSIAVLVGTVLQVGGTIGTFGLAWMVSKGGFVRTMSATFAIACVSIAFIGQPGLSLPLLFVVVFIAGWCVVGSQPGLNALAATYYPTYMRATGVGAGLGIGRIGAIVGPVIGGEFLRRQMTNQDIFLAAAVPALVSAIVMFALRWTMTLPREDPAAH